MPNMILKSNSSIKVTRLYTDNVLSLIQHIENKKRLLVLEIKTLSFLFLCKSKIYQNSFRFKPCM